MCFNIFELAMENRLWCTPSGQYPAAMDECRRALLPVMRQYRQEEVNIKLVRDRLYVNGNLYMYHHNSDQDEPSSQDGESVHPGR